jgi:cell filamentation protein
MPDNKYCYPDSDVLINKLNITDKKDLFEAEKELTAIRLRELQESPIKGKYDFAHLKAIHQYIFQDIYSWAGKERTVEIGKGNLFCTTACIQDYANSVFRKYFFQCYAAKNNFEDFVRIFADNYGDLNALHPFREGNGRAQREFARMVCLECGYGFNLSCTTHLEMLEASKLSFDKGDSSLFIKIFSKAVTSYDSEIKGGLDTLSILTFDDLVIDLSGGYDYYGYNEHKDSKVYNEIYKAKINKMNDER